MLVQRSFSLVVCAVLRFFCQVWEKLLHLCRETTCLYELLHELMIWIEQHLFQQVLQFCGFSPVWAFLTWRSPTCLEGYGFSPVWIVMQVLITYRSCIGSGLDVTRSYASYGYIQCQCKHFVFVLAIVLFWPCISSCSRIYMLASGVRQLTNFSVMENERKSSPIDNDNELIMNYTTIYQSSPTLL